MNDINLEEEKFSVLNLTEYLNYLKKNKISLNKKEIKNNYLNYKIYLNETIKDIFENKIYQNDLIIIKNKDKIIFSFFILNFDKNFDKIKTFILKDEQSIFQFINKEKFSSYIKIIFEYILQEMFSNEIKQNEIFIYRINSKK